MKRQTGLLLRPISNPTLPRSMLTTIWRTVCALACSAAVCTPDLLFVTTMPGSSANSIRSVTRRTASPSSAAGTSTVSTSRHANPTGMLPARRIATDVRAGRPIEMKDQPDSKLTPSSSLGLMIEGCYRGDGVRDFSRDDEGEEQVEEDRMEDDGGGSMYQTPPPPLKKTLITKASLASVASRASTSSAKHTTSSVKSQTPIRKSTTTSSSIRISSSSVLRSCYLIIIWTIFHFNAIRVLPPSLFFVIAYNAIHAFLIS